MKKYYAVKDLSGSWVVRAYGDNPRNTMTMTQLQFECFTAKNEVTVTHCILDHEEMLEAQFMASIALNGGTTRITPEMYWESARLSLGKAYGVSL